MAPAPTATPPSAAAASTAEDEVFTRYNGMVAAHAIMATMAFGLVFPSGGILIRIASFPKLWLAHGILQLFGYILYIAAFALGVYMASHARLLNNAHPIIGIVVFLLVIFQPFLGFIHHVAFKSTPVGQSGATATSGLAASPSRWVLSTAVLVYNSARGRGSLHRAREPLSGMPLRRALCGCSTWRAWSSGRGRGVGRQL